VTLRGSVGGFHQKREAMKAAERVRGVVEVDNQLEVQLMTDQQRADADLRGAVTVTDEELLARLGPPARLLGGHNPRLGSPARQLRSASGGGAPLTLNAGTEGKTATGRTCRAADCAARS
jgi:BON domain-containing protein